MCNWWAAVNGSSMGLTRARDSAVTLDVSDCASSSSNAGVWTQSRVEQIRNFCSNSIDKNQIECTHTCKGRCDIVCAGGNHGKSASLRENINQIWQTWICISQTFSEERLRQKRRCLTPEQRFVILLIIKVITVHQLCNAIITRTNLTMRAELEGCIAVIAATTWDNPG